MSEGKPEQKQKRIGWKMWIFMIQLVWALAATALVFNNPAPFPDHGSCIFS